VSTQPEKIHAFFQQLTRVQPLADEPFLAALEVCGFNDWLIRLLHDYPCHKVILIQPEERKQRKTDRRDKSGRGRPVPQLAAARLSRQALRARSGPAVLN
jgi:hypothetical protein